MGKFRVRRPIIFRQRTAPAPKPGWVYVPPKFAVETNETLNHPQAGHQLKIRRCVYRNMVVDFAFVQIFWLNGHPCHVAKIDCCWGKVHRHQYVRSTGEDIIDHECLQIIPERDPYSVIDGWYDRSLTMMEYEWDENFRRWDDVGADE